MTILVALIHSFGHTDKCRTSPSTFPPPSL